MFTALNTIYGIVGKENISTLSFEGRYACKLQKKNGVESKFYFATPIANGSVLVEKCFDIFSNGYSFQGSGGKIEIFPEGIVLRNAECEIRFLWEREQSFHISEDHARLTSEEMSISPTFSGVKVMQKYQGPLYFTCIVQSKKKGHIRMNSKSFAYMKDKFLPHFTLSTMYANKANGLLGVNLAMKQEGDTKVRLRMIASDKEATSLCWEMNWYEPKLIQDTTVESARPSENNVYGNIAFLGHTPDHGVQYLYSRFDLTKINADPSQRMERVLLHIPYYQAGEQGFRVFAPFRRFCSFGSNWENKMPASEFCARYEKKNGCFVFDLSQYLLNQNGGFTANTGVVFCSAVADGASILSTADNYDRPQIIEIQYEKEKNYE